MPTTGLPPRHHVEQAVNVAPMIDVLLVLLIAAFVFIALGRHTTSLVVPRPDQSGPANPAPQIVLTLTAGSGYTVNNQPVPAGELGDFLRTVFERRPVRLLFIDADGSRSYQDVIHAIGIARSAGVQVVSLMPAAQAAAITRTGR